MAAQVTFPQGILAQKYDGNPKSVTATTVPAGLNYTVTYGGSATPPTALGSYAVVATVVDPVETGSASGTLVISKGDQAITILGLEPKTYGDASFTVTATANSGLPITQWQSSDPSVATISPAGLVTLVGAGQTSIIASNIGNSNYNSGWGARPLNVAKSLAPVPSGTLAVTYNGSAQGLNPGPLPSGQATEITYRNTSVPEAAATPQVVFQNGPDTLALSYLGTGLQTSAIWALGKLAGLGGTARKLHSCDVTLLSWGRYDTSSPYGFQAWANVHPDLVVAPTPGVSVPGNSGGYYHPVTLSFYEYVNTGAIESYRLLTTKTVQAFIPWRPANGVDGVSVYPYNGYAFRVAFSFPDGVILPPEVLVGVGFNTTTRGTAPVGVVGPYDALNVAHPDGQQAGTTLLASSLPFKDWRWGSASGNTGPMLRLRAVPTNATFTAPVNAGTYEVKTQSTAFGADSASNSTLLINKAPFSSWQNLAFSGSSLPPEETIETADPDGDGLSNFLEYAFNLNPVLGDASSATGFKNDGGILEFIYRRNLNALDLDYTLQGGSDLADPSSWQAVTPLSEIIVSDDGATRVIKASVAKPIGAPLYFIRMKAVQ